MLVAHSMGGLIAKYFSGVLGGSSEIRQTIAIGTPFQGAVKAAFLLSQGRGGPLPLPRQRLKSLARTLPAVHELLPSYRCLEQGDATRRLTPLDVAQFGGDFELAQAAAGLHETLAGVHSSSLKTVVGIEQTTMQSLRLQHGVAQPLYYIPETDARINWRGDGTVYAEAATGGVQPISSLPQSHGALARTSEAIAAVCAELTRRRLGPPMGAESVGLDVPDLIAAGQLFEILVSGRDAAPGMRYRVVDVDSGMQVAQSFLIEKPPAMSAKMRLPHAGLYRIAVKGSGFSVTSQIVMATAADQDRVIQNE